MNSHTGIRMELKSVLGEEKKVLSELDKLFSSSKFRKEDCEEFKIAVSEVCINAIEHGNNEVADLSVFVTVMIHGNRIVCTVSDYGNGFNEKAISHLDRGWGLKLVEHFVDSWTTFQTDPLDSLFSIRIDKKLRKKD
ncbi:ATP-binding protein [Bacillus sp. Marseille-P3661]|uniref:ATP-binding protein n=1 Tax=Bacillus sp. Marseille-P3661 TaxID=1936234 RepID=UPI000C867EF0|nr:ATP-binding protein [Bacillus sp. Marseille-P3661]